MCYNRRPNHDEDYENGEILMENLDKWFMRLLIASTFIAALVGGSKWK